MAKRARKQSGAKDAAPGFSFDAQPKASLTPEFWHDTGTYDPHIGLDPWRKRRAAGKALRAETPREAHAGWSPEPGAGSGSPGAGTGLERAASRSGSPRGACGR